MIKIDNTPKFKIGDMVWSDIQERVAIIKDYNVKYDAYELDDGFMSEEDDLEPLDKEEVKNQFLNELQLLLDKYKARIYDYDRYRIYADVGNETISWYTNQLSEITPLNIFDYDKD